MFFRFEVGRFLVGILLVEVGWIRRFTGLAVDLLAISVRFQKVRQGGETTGGGSGHTETDGRNYTLLLDVAEHDSIDGWPSISYKQKEMQTMNR